MVLPLFKDDNNNQPEGFRYGGESNVDRISYTTLLQLTLLTPLPCVLLCVWLFLCVCVCGLCMGLLAYVVLLFACFFWGVLYYTHPEISPLTNDPEWFKIAQFYPEMCLNGVNTQVYSRGVIQNPLEFCACLLWCGRVAGFSGGQSPPAQGAPQGPGLRVESAPKAALDMCMCVCVCACVFV